MGRALSLLTTVSLLTLIAASATATAAADGAATDGARVAGDHPAGPSNASVDAYRATVDLEPLDDDSDGDGVPRVTGVEKDQVKRGMVVASLANGNRVALTDSRSARKGRNPQTGKEIKIPAKKTAKDDGGRHAPFHDKYRPGVADIDDDGHLDLAVANPRRSGDALTLTIIPLPTGHHGTDTAIGRCAPTTNEAELLAAVASAADITKADAKRTRDASIDTTTK